jgi:hypothetical protein
MRPVFCVTAPKMLSFRFSLTIQTRAAFSRKSYAGLLHGTLARRWNDW